MSGPIPRPSGSTVQGGAGHRWIENSLAILGGLLVAAYVLGVEVFPHIVYTLGKCSVPPQDRHGIPWGVIISAGVLVLPKLVSRATYGRVWDGLATKFGAGKRES